MLRTALIICAVACVTPAVACKSYYIGCGSDAEIIAGAIDRQTKQLEENAYRGSRDALLQSMDKEISDYENSRRIQNSIDYQTIINDRRY